MIITPPINRDGVTKLMSPPPPLVTQCDVLANPPPTPSGRHEILEWPLSTGTGLTRLVPPWHQAYLGIDGWSTKSKKKIFLLLSFNVRLF